MKMRLHKWIASFDFYSRTNQLIIDGCIFAACLLTAWMIRFEGWPEGIETRQLSFWIPIVVFSRLAVHYYRGIYRFVWRFVSLSDAVVIFESLSIVTAALLVVRLVTPARENTAFIALPLSVIALEFLMSFTVSMAARMLRRFLYEGGKRRAADCERPPIRLLLYGAGKAGILLLQELQGRRDVQVIGFVDDDPRKVGTVICGADVLGTGRNLAELRKSFSADEVAITMATASRKTLIRILSECRRIDIPAKIIPSLQEILDRRVSIGELQDIHLDDLLGRHHIRVDHVSEDARHCYAGKRILVTGGGGSIGSELVRQLAAIEPGAVAILDKDENSVYELHQELLSNGAACCLEPLIADVRNPGRLRTLFAEFRPQIVFHAAAHKHVPLMEKHPCEAILNNVVGTSNVLEAARQFGSERFVFISTDKAVNPSSIMGASKRVGELLVQTCADAGPLQTACVRFGNVLGSRGSIVPLFQKQIAHGGPITITHPDVVRFFMTIPEAVQLILCAGTLANRGEIFVLDMGNPRKIIDLAHELIQRSGLQTGKQIEIAITGLRPGEKLVEELTTQAEHLAHTTYEKLSVIQPSAIDEAAFQLCLTELKTAAEANDSAAVYGILGEMRIGFTSLRNQPVPPATVLYPAAA